MDRRGAVILAARSRLPGLLRVPPEIAFRVFVTTDSTSPDRPRAAGGKLTGLLVILFLVGTLSTGLWLGGVEFPGLVERLLSWPVLLSLLVCVTFTAANLLTRWLRWHFLLRRFTRHVVTRDSLVVFLATLPAIATPFFLGELVRVLFLRRKFRKPASYLVRIWVTERALDAGVLLTFYLMATERGLGALPVFALVVSAAVLFRIVLGGVLAPSVGFVTGASLLLTVFAWTLPVLALFGVVRLFSHPASLAVAAHSFSAGTLFGGFTGLPLGVYVTGSTMIADLARLGVPADIAILSILVYRAGTAWFAVALGLAAIGVFRARLASLLRGTTEQHFDELAPSYEDEIPVHVRTRLVDKKVGYIRAELALRGIGSGACGLDLGCGQGWYLAELARSGYRMHGIDHSGGQIEWARSYLRGLGVVGGRLLRADAQALPFDDNTFDFVYSINAFHHILAPSAQRRALQETVRVLQPGGVFVLHEMNTHNPLFRFYMGYVFPLLKRIDEGNEEWLFPSALPEARGGRWLPEVKYFTFVPDFVPQILQRLVGGAERWLERSRFRRFSAHYQACLIKES